MNHDQCRQLISFVQGPCKYLINARLTVDRDRVRWYAQTTESTGSKDRGVANGHLQSDLLTSNSVVARRMYVQRVRTAPRMCINVSAPGCFTLTVVASWALWTGSTIRGVWYGHRIGAAGSDRQCDRRRRAYRYKLNT